jgi:uncharacterized protein (TIGR03435 family)
MRDRPRAVLRFSSLQSITVQLTKPRRLAVHDQGARRRPHYTRQADPGELTKLLSSLVGRQVIDRTDLTGTYVVELTY